MTAEISEINPRGGILCFLTQRFYPSQKNRLLIFLIFYASLGRYFLLLLLLCNKVLKHYNFVLIMNKYKIKLFFFTFYFEI